MKKSLNESINKAVIQADTECSIAGVSTQKKTWAQLEAESKQPQKKGNNNA